MALAVPGYFILYGYGYTGKYCEQGGPKWFGDP